MAQNENTNFMASVMNAINGVSNNNGNASALTLGLGFHKFNGTETVREVLESIGADFHVEKQDIVRLPKDIISQIRQGLAVTIDPSLIIHTHCATVNTRDNSTLGVVGSDYGVIQNTKAFDILDLLTGNKEYGNFNIVSAGIVHDADPYIQVRIPREIRINGDNSNTELYASFYTRHDGKGGLKVAVSAIRVVCQNTFTANFQSKMKITYRHTKNVDKLLNFDDGDNVKRVSRIIEGFNVFTTEHIQKLNHLASQQITERYINEFCNRIFVNDEELQKLARQHGYNWESVEIPNAEDPTKPRTISKRVVNQISKYRETLENGIGQDTNRGSRLWMWNGLTNYFSNVYDYPSHEKRFNNLMLGTATEKMNNAIELLETELVA